MKTLQEFVNEMIGKYPYEVPIDGFSKSQANPEECVTLIKAYAHECFNSKFKQNNYTFGNGHVTWKTAPLSDYCTKMTVSEVEKSGGFRIGDIVSCTGSSSIGHVVICLSNCSSFAEMQYLDEWRNGGRPKIRSSKSREALGVLRPFVDLGTYNGDQVGSAGAFGSSDGFTVTYTKMKGQGRILNDYTDLYWYNTSNQIKPWGFYGMQNETIDFLGLVDKKYYYGWVYGICQSKIKCLVPVKKVDKQKATILKETSSFNVGNIVNSSGNSKSSGSMSSENIVTIGAGYGTFATREFSIDGYKSFNWAKGTAQRRVWQTWKDKGYPTVNGFAAIEGKILIACTTYFGKVGDNITWEFSNGDTLDTIVGDIKSQKDPGCNKYGHNNGKCVLEFCGVPTGIKGYNNPYLYFGWTKVNKAANHGHYI